MAEQRVALITGSSRGIGRHLVQHLVARNFEVVGCSRSAVESMEAANHTHVVADVGLEEDIAKLFRAIRTKYGRLDIVINNAAVNPAIGLSMLTTRSAATETLMTNVLGTFSVSREAAKLMMRGKWGRIINFSSMAARHEVAGEAIYSASKAAIQTLTRVMAKEFYRYGITCNAIAPAAIETDMMNAVPRDALREILARNAIPEMGRLEDVSNAVDWLIQPESQAVTGQVIFLGGA
jgi:3-oxoacyl-[acyl-carrier protein] reductase